MLYRNKKWLKRKYIDEQLYIKDVAKLCGVADCTVARWLRRFGISRPRIYGYLCSHIKRLESVEAAYLAACIDCDGSVIFRKKGGHYIEVSNTNLFFLERLQGMCNGGKTTEKIYNREHGYKPFYQLRFRTRETFDLLPQIIPFMVIKKEKAAQLLERMKCLLKK